MLAFNGKDAASIICLTLMGGLAFPIYSVAIAYTNDWIEQSQRAGAAALLVRVNGIGAFLGPLLAAPALSVSLDIYFWMTGAILSASTAYLVYRVFSHDAPPVEEQGPYQPFPLRASRMVVALLYRRPRQVPGQ
jgi:MFS family permease